jgi:PAS domain S-box-containing protein
VTAPNARAAVQWWPIWGCRVREGYRSADETVASLSAAIWEADLALALIDLDEMTFLSVSHAASHGLGLSAEAMIGRPVTDFVSPDEREPARSALEVLNSGAINIYVARRTFHALDGAEPFTTAWLRRFEIDGRRLALAQVAVASGDTVSPIAAQLGHEPTTMAIGTMDSAFTLTAISQDVKALLGRSPQELVGERLLDLVARGDVSSLRAASDRLITNNTLGTTIHVQDGRAQWIALCCLLTPLTGGPGRCFILAPELDTTAERSRISKLEHHLAQIAGVIAVSGVLQGMSPMRDMKLLPQVNDLPTRQWEVLARVVHGDRVPTIAADLHLSQSTVRNHLSAIFKRFGVKSQPELLRVVRDALDGT